jgi:polygalacturonase
MNSSFYNIRDVYHDAGGGKVLLPAGNYVSGTIYLQ